MSDHVRKEKHLAYMLRHDKDYAFDEHGWREVCDLVENHDFSCEELEYIVANSSKQRFEFSEDKLLIRACQGHSFPVDVQLDAVTPPEYLYHGTSVSKLPPIMKKGLLRMSRQYVHLSFDEVTAEEVGSRRKGEVAILRVAARKMWEDGHRFWLSRNGVWLVAAVPPEYLSVISPLN